MAQRNSMKHFYSLLVNTLIANVTTTFLWFCLTFWVYLETRSVLATAIIGGAYMLLASAAAIPFGTFVDHNKKKRVMQLATYVALVAFIIGLILFVSIPEANLLALNQPWFWLFTVIILSGSVIESARNIALSTTVTILVPEKNRDKANGLVGTVAGISFLVTSVFSGLTIGFLGMGWALAIAVALMAASAIHLFFISIPEEEIEHVEGAKKVDIRGSIDAIKSVPGLFGLIIFTTFNNLLGGVFMALLDPYGLSLMSVQAYGIFTGVTSIGYIVGGLLIAKRGLGKSPLKTLLRVNIIMWIICILFPTISILPFLAIGMFSYMCLIPYIEAVEQTIIQKVVPLKRQGRVFGFAQAIEAASAPLMAFMVGPIAEFIVLPAMGKEGAWSQSIGSWFGTGDVRGIALIFIVAGIIGLIMTLLAFKTRSYRLLSKHYQK